MSARLAAGCPASGALKMDAVNITVRRLLVLAGGVLVAACASVPAGPRMLALPGTGQSLEGFNRDDRECRQAAFERIGGRTDSPLTGYVGQQQYDNTYMQCMYAKGQRVPVPASMANSKAVRSDDTGIPPPPPGMPPPPPPGVSSPPVSR